MIEKESMTDPIEETVVRAPIPRIETDSGLLYDAVQFQTRLHEILSLYARETHMLSRSIRIPHLLSLAREAITQTVTTVMEQEAETLAREVTRTVYRRGK